ncbi:ABC transporter permease VraG [Staphylococcus epidermidis]|uniref:ABC transporter permease VraG n=1 Tax=Staphylococcus epidermidis TaxID=1282 RepID=UPI0001F49074|nr:ABC transporter permease VraG [Staphylococcus epidermidis]EFV89482.1 ABC transporter permease [Staphylococcus epidermidis FRI909]MBE7303213.1 ABC transporter permease [Staphylococcus epidermidis]MCG1301013.1 ABC transporter permease VraG [Staphylococcus epidermidis]MCG1438086.1 ABC transporter permease VraG [Staphylococcus epidermidis]MCG1751967.1 ABC transporter permease VraG [Staphylococcus epidermidis]
MSFNEIIFKNFKQNVTHYAIYLLSLVISVVLYFSFVTLKYAHHLHGNQSFPVIKEGSQVGSYFLFIIIVVFLLYANFLFLKRRGRELSLLQIIGLTKKDIMKMIMLEQLMTFMMTTIVGIILGIFGSKILLMIVLRLLGINVSVSIIFNYHAILETLLLIAVSYVLIVFQSYVYLLKRSIKELASDVNKKEFSHTRTTLGEVVLGVLGIIMIVSGYIMSTKLVDNVETIIQPFAILFLTVIGSYFFFRSTVSLIFKAIQRLRNGTVSVTDVMFTSPIIYRVKKNAFSLTIMTVVSAITVSVLCFAALSRSTLTNEVLLSSPHDVTLKNQKQANELAFKLNNRNIEHYYNYKEVVYAKVYKDHLFSEGVYRPKEITVTSDKYIPNVSTKKGQTDIIIPRGSLKDVVKTDKKGTAYVGSKKFRLKVSLRKGINKVYFMSDVDRGRPTLILNDEDYQKIREHIKEKNIVSQYGFDLKNKNDLPELEQLVSSINEDIETRSEAASEISSLTGILLFVTSFLGITFLIAAGCIIYIKQIDETEDELENYTILRKLGFTHQDMSKGLKLKVIFNFGLPLIIALLHAYFASLAYMHLMNVTNQIPIFIVMAVYTATYAVFAIIAYNHSKRTIKHSI